MPSCSPVKSTTCATWLTRSAAGTTPVSRSAIPTPAPLVTAHAFCNLIELCHTVFAAVESYCPWADDMLTRASPHTRHTAEDEVNDETAEPGTVAENPPTIRSSWVTCPPSERTRFSAEVEACAASRTITGNACDGCAAARGY